MKNIVLGSLLFAALGAVSEAKAVSRISCAGGDVTVNVDVDVLESLPPQSMISVKRNGQNWGGFAAFTDYLELESYPVQYQWRFQDRNSDKLLIVTTTQPSSRGPRKAKGTYHYNRATSPILLNCNLQ